MTKRKVTDGDGSERTCIVSGHKGPPETMLRFALSGAGVATPDIRRKLPGRGVWTRLSADAVRLAVARKAFSRAFRAAVETPADLPGLVDQLIERDALQFLSLANKAGLAVAGAFKVDEAIAKGKIAALLRASDGAADGVAKREQGLRARLGAQADNVARINLFSSAQLGLALGKANVIHAALDVGAATSAFLERAERLRLYRMGGEASGRSTRVPDASAPGFDDVAVNGGDEPERADEPGDWDHT